MDAFQAVLWIRIQIGSIFSNFFGSVSIFRIRTGHKITLGSGSKFGQNSGSGTKYNVFGSTTLTARLKNLVSRKLGQILCPESWVRPCVQKVGSDLVSRKLGQILCPASWVRPCVQKFGSDLVSRKLGAVLVSRKLGQILCPESWGQIWCPEGWVRSCVQKVRGRSGSGKFPRY